MTPSARLAALIARLPTDGDEVRVLASVADGLVRGLEQYGPLDLSRDRRDWRAETVAEHRDAVVYLTAQLLREEDE